MRQSKRAELSPAGAIGEKFEEAVSGETLQLTKAVAARVEAWMRVEGAAEFRAMEMEVAALSRDTGLLL